MENGCRLNNRLNTGMDQNQRRTIMRPPRSICRQATLPAPNQVRSWAVGSVSEFDRPWFKSFLFFDPQTKKYTPLPNSKTHALSFPSRQMWKLTPPPHSIIQPCLSPAPKTWKLTPPPNFSSGWKGGTSFPLHAGQKAMSFLPTSNNNKI